MTNYLIVGTYRTGSSALAELLGLRPDITCGWESTRRAPRARKLRIAEELFAGDFRNLEAREREFLDKMHHPGKRAIGFRALFRSSDKWLLHPRTSPGLWLDRLEGHIRWLARRRPDVHVIHLVRRDNLRWLKSLYLAKASGLYFGRAYPETLRISIDVDAGCRRVLSKRWITARLRTLASTNPYTEVVYEDFLGDNAGIARRLVEFLGCDASAAPVRPPELGIQSARTGAAVVNIEELEAGLARRGLLTDS
jgi:hypothetical protein